MTLETARAILNSGRNEQRTVLTGPDATDRLAFEQHMARLRAQPMTWAPLAAFTGALSLRRGRWV